MVFHENIEKNIKLKIDNSVNKNANIENSNSKVEEIIEV